MYRFEDRHQKTIMVNTGRTTDGKWPIIHKCRGRDSTGLKRFTIATRERLGVGSVGYASARFALKFACIQKQSRDQFERENFQVHDRNVELHKRYYLPRKWHDKTKPTWNTTLSPVSSKYPHVYKQPNDSSPRRKLCSVYVQSDVLVSYNLFCLFKCIQTRCINNKSLSHL